MHTPYELVQCVKLQALLAFTLYKLIWCVHGRATCCVLMCALRITPLIKLPKTKLLYLQLHVSHLTQITQTHERAAEPGTLNNLAHHSYPITIYTHLASAETLARSHSQSPTSCVGRGVWTSAARTSQAKLAAAWRRPHMPF